MGNRGLLTIACRGVVFLRLYHQYGSSPPDEWPSAVAKLLLAGGWASAGELALRVVKRLKTGVCDTRVEALELCMEDMDVAHTYLISVGDATTVDYGMVKGLTAEQFAALCGVRDGAVPRMVARPACDSAEGAEFVKMYDEFGDVLFCLRTAPGWVDRVRAFALHTKVGHGQRGDAMGGVANGAGCLAAQLLTHVSLDCGWLVGEAELPPAGVVVVRFVSVRGTAVQCIDDGHSLALPPGALI